LSRAEVLGRKPRAGDEGAEEEEQTGSSGPLRSPGGRTFRQEFPDFVNPAKAGIQAVWTKNLHRL
jgi:hypothetical protein